jgi:F-type H+-transporting ATPase subunit gamma
MPSLKQIKTRIKSTQNLKKITKALEVVSTVKLQKNKARTEYMRDYFVKLTQLIAKIGDYTHLFRETINPKADRDLVILISSDKWLCGPSNSKLFKNITEQYRDYKDTTDLFVIGKKWLEFAARSGYTVVGSLMLGDDYSQSDLAALFACCTIS